MILTRHLIHHRASLYISITEIHMGNVIQMPERINSFVFSFDDMSFRVSFDDVERYVLGQDVHIPADVIRIIVAEWFLMKTEDES